MRNCIGILAFLPLLICAQNCINVDSLGPIDSISITTANWDAVVYYNLDTTLATIILIHGGAMLYGTHWEYLFMKMLLSKAGYNVVGINYRLGPVQQPGCLDSLGVAMRSFRAQVDIREAIDWMASRPEFNFDPDRLFMFGESAGATLTVSYTSPDWVWDLYPTFDGPMPPSIPLAGMIIEQSSIWEGSLPELDLPTVFLFNPGDHNAWFTTYPCATVGGEEAMSLSLYQKDQCVWKGIRSSCQNTPPFDGHFIFSYPEKCSIANCFMEAVLGNTCVNAVFD